MLAISISILWGRRPLFHEADRNFPKHANGTQGQVPRTRLPPQVAWEGDGTYLLVVLFGPQGCPHVLGGGRVDGGAVLRAVVVALAHAWESGKHRVTGVTRATRPVSDILQDSRPAKCSFQFHLGTTLLEQAGNISVLLCLF